MASTSRFRAIWLSNINIPDSQDDHQQFFQTLLSRRGYLVHLYDVGPRNPQERRTVEAGRVLLNGRSIAVNSDFARQVVFISQELNVSERYVVGLLQETIAGNPNVFQERLIEATILEFHLRRRHLAYCLRYIFEAAEVAQAPSSPELFQQKEQFTKKNLLEASKNCKN
ncbi:hypothetical protein PsYK624_172620 [Phanerochaete sordida]|uniref:Uncharacterized protein n=1 Tax=Phanerochaete sordida TaxID=48140 RepID=A0A9P3GSV7_9APHY|nr:hypothetical protein PsYK624_172620 [Phanerochaete sordida]